MRCKTLTPSARHWLTHTTSAQVLSVFDRACNLINSQADILAVVVAERGSHPFSLTVASDSPAPFRDVSTHSQVTVTATRLEIDSLSIDVTQAKDWNPAPPWRTLSQHLTQSPETLTQLADCAQVAKPTGSLLDLYTNVVHTGRHQIVLDRARCGATCLVRGLRAGLLDDCLAGVKWLAGLGGGLTPAGDDFIVGILLAIWAGQFGPQAEALCEPIVEVATPLTTSLSGAYLRAAAGGECMQLWHSVFAAILRKDQDQLSFTTRDLLSIGHTSGADALAGFLAPNLLLRS